MKKLILASSSKSRLGLLKSVGIVPDLLLSPDIDESHLKKETPRNLSSRLADQKATKAFEMFKESNNYTEGHLLVSADTVAAVGRRVLEKAASDDDVRSYLNLCSGRNCRVYSSFCVVDCDTGRRCLKTVETRLKIRVLSKHDVEFYVKLGDGIGKAGGFGIAGYAETFIKKIVGSYSAVIGLPMTELDLTLRSFGFHQRIL